MNQKKPKREKLEINKGKHLYLDDVQSIVVEDKASFECNMKKLSCVILKRNQSTDILNSLMEQTFTNRRISVLNSELGVLEICEQYPLLRKPNMKVIYDDMFSLVFIYMEVSPQFDHITGLVNSMDKFCY